MSVEIPWDEEAELRAQQERLDGLTATLFEYMGLSPNIPTKVIHVHEEDGSGCERGWIDADDRDLLGP
jgi:hypothetical protein